MWEFAGEIEYVCDNCSDSNSISIDEFDIDDIGGSEGPMGDVSVYKLTHTFNCYECLRLIDLSFEVSEYPVGFISFTINNCSGAKALNEPEIEYKREIYTNEDLFELYESISELVYSLKCQPEFTEKLDPRQFEEVVAEIFRDQGFEVELTKRTRDGGKDIIALSKDKLGFTTKYIIECKHYSEKNKVGVDVVRGLYGVKNSRSGGNIGIIVTTSTFTSDARKFVKNETSTDFDLSLADRDQLLGWLENYRRY